MQRRASFLGSVSASGPSSQDRVLARTVAHLPTSPSLARPTPPTFSRRDISEWLEVTNKPYVSADVPGATVHSAWREVLLKVGVNFNTNYECERTLLKRGMTDDEVPCLSECRYVKYP